MIKDMGSALESSLEILQAGFPKLEIRSKQFSRMCLRGGIQTESSNVISSRDSIKMFEVQDNKQFNSQPVINSKINRKII